MFKRICLAAPILALSATAASVDPKWALLLVAVGALGFALRDRRSLFGTSQAYEI